MLGNAALWETANRCEQLLTAAKIPHAVVGGVAVCLHGYQRNTIDLDLLIRPEDAQHVREALEQSGFTWREAQHEFVGTEQIPVQFLYAGESAGAGSGVSLPDPSETAVVTTREGLTVLNLAKLIELKLACGEGNLRRTHKDFADVVELIAVNRLDASFAPRLHKSLRKTYRALVKRANQ
jgi:hypothetical protein